MDSRGARQRRPAQRRAAPGPAGSHARGHSLLGGALLGGARGRRQAGERLRRAILAGEMATGPRLVEEELAAMTGVTRAITAAQAAQLTDLGTQMRRSVADGEPLKYSALNRELHRLIREFSGQTVAASLLERLNGQLVRHQFQLSLRPGRPQESLPEHLAIIAAITAGRPAEAEQATRRHLHSVIATRGRPGAAAY